MTLLSTVPDLNHEPRGQGRTIHCLTGRARQRRGTPEPEQGEAGSRALTRRRRAGSTGGPSTGQIEHGDGGKRAQLRTEPYDHGSNGGTAPGHGRLGEHVVDTLLRHIGQQWCLADAGCHDSWTTLRQALALLQRATTSRTAALSMCARRRFLTTVRPSSITPWESPRRRETSARPSSDPTPGVAALIASRAASGHASE